MIQGLTLATQGMTLQAQKQDEIANNLANMNTTGYKGSGLFVKSFHKYLSNSQNEVFANREMKADEVFTDFSQGPAVKSGNDLDVMIRGSGFFTVMSPEGVRYTRNGNFSVSKDGFIVTGEGDKVMGRDGFIRLDTDIGGSKVRINTNGEVLQGNNSLGTLKIADFKKPYTMSRSGNSLFYPTAERAPVVESAGFELTQGFLEGSNVSPIRSMVEMIGAYRNYEADSKALQAQDETLEKAVNQVGKL